jgi:hypothetical protein
VGSVSFPCELCSRLFREACFARTRVTLPLHANVCDFYNDALYSLRPFM